MDLEWLNVARPVKTDINENIDIIPVFTWAFPFILASEELTCSVSEKIK